MKRTTCTKNDRSENTTIKNGTTGMIYAIQQMIEAFCVNYLNYINN